MHTSTGCTDSTDTSRLSAKKTLQLMRFCGRKSSRAYDYLDHACTLMRIGLSHSIVRSANRSLFSSAMSSSENHFPSMGAKDHQYTRLHRNRSIARHSVLALVITTDQFTLFLRWPSLIIQDPWSRLASRRGLVELVQERVVPVGLVSHQRCLLCTFDRSVWPHLTPILVQREGAIIRSVGTEAKSPPDYQTVGC